MEEEMEKEEMEKEEKEKEEKEKEEKEKEEMEKEEMEKEEMEMEEMEKEEMEKEKEEKEKDGPRLSRGGRLVRLGTAKKSGAHSRRKRCLGHRRCRCAPTRSVWALERDWQSVGECACASSRASGIHAVASRCQQPWRPWSCAW